MLGSAGLETTVRLQAANSDGVAQLSAWSGPLISPVPIEPGLQAQGYRIKCVWAARETVALNKYADQLSRLARVTLTKTNLAEEVELVEGAGRINVYRRNP